MANLWQIKNILLGKIFPQTPTKPGVLTGKTFSHTPDEGRSVGLAKACVLQQIYSVLEKISYKYIIQTE